MTTATPPSANYRRHMAKPNPCAGCVGAKAPNHVLLAVPALALMCGLIVWVAGLITGQNRLARPIQPALNATQLVERGLREYGARTPPSMRSYAMSDTGVQ